MQFLSTLSPLSRWQWFKISWLFSVFSILIGYLIASQYLTFISVSTPLGAGYLSSAFIGQIGLLGLLFTLPIALLVSLIKQPIINTGLLWLSASSLLLLLILDTQIYSLYRFHLSGFVWNLVFSEGGSQIFSFSWYSILIAGVSIVALMLLIAGTLFGAIYLIRRNMPSVRYFQYVSIPLILLSFLGANGLHIWYDAQGNTEIRAMTRHLPLYEPATAVRYMAERGWIDPHNINQAPDFKQVASNSALKYPKAPLTVNTQDRPNILVIAIDAWRADEFNATTTPNTFALRNSPTALQFTDHHSGGNVTKGGMFSLFYGLPPTYWDAFTAAQQPPTLFTTLQSLDYQTGIYASGPLINPSFHRNVFSSIDPLTTMTEGDTPYIRDQQMVRNFQSFLDNNQQQPFIGMLFFDAAHGYAPPDDYQPRFEPYWERVDHVELGPDFDPLPYKNRYRTALHFIDKQIQGVIDDLKERDLYDNSIIIFTADHGEEFNETELNYWGHGSNFTRHQTQVPLLVLWPGKAKQTINYRTSHYDIVPTLMQEVFNVSEPMASYSSGHSLFSEGNRDWLLVHSYFNYGVVMPDRLIATYPTGQFEITDLEQKPSKLTMPASTTLEVLKEISRFYQ